MFVCAPSLATSLAAPLIALPVASWGSVLSGLGVSGVLTVLMGLFIVIMLPFAIKESRRRQQQAQRQIDAAIRGEPNAIPLARIQPNPEKAPKYLAEPLYIPSGVRLTIGSCMLATTLAVMLLAALLVILASLGTAARYLESALGHGLDYANAHASPNTFWLAIIGPVVLVFSALLCIAGTAPFYTITATEEGLTRRSLWRQCFIPWTNARLFLVRGQQFEMYREPQPLQYTLYGVHVKIMWAEDKWPTARNDRLYTLVDIIGFRTGLSLRTFDSRLLPA